MTHVPIYDLPYFTRNVRAVLSMAPLKDRATVVYLQGDLGAGKTTFVQHLAKEWGIEGVTSPTYVLMKSYPIAQDRNERGGKRRFSRMVHIDAYRLNGAKEFAALKPEDFLEDAQTVVLVEWPEKAGDALPKPDLTLKFSADDLGPDERDIVMEE